jgi:hypothetical protein
MQPVPKAHVDRLVRYLENLKKLNPRPAHELGLNELANLLNKVGFTGPVNKPGTVRGFSHELLQSHPMLVDGQFTVHITGKKVVTISYRDFKRYVMPYVEQVLATLQQQGLIVEENKNV